MTYDFCLSCGVLLLPHVLKCPVCGFNNSFDEEGDIVLDDQFIADFNDEFLPENDYSD